MELSKNTAIILFISVTIAFISISMPNPFLKDCNIFGCVTGQGWPIPFYYKQYCQTGDVGCRDNYFSFVRFIIDALLFYTILFLLLRIFKNIKNQKVYKR